MNRNIFGNRTHENSHQAVGAALASIGRPTFDRQEALLDRGQDESAQRSRALFHDPRSAEPVRGALVVSSDGAEVGEVADINRAHFQVAPTTGHSFWLSNDHILTVGESRLTLALAAPNIDEFRVSRPQGETWEPPALDPLQDGLLSQNEQQDQRERMEQELRAQVQRLPRD